jgi:hypothetical protein
MSEPIGLLGLAAPAPPPAAAPGEDPAGKPFSACLSDASIGTEAPVAPARAKPATWAGLEAALVALLIPALPPPAPPNGPPPSAAPGAQPTFDGAAPLLLAPATAAAPSPAERPTAEAAAGVADRSSGQPDDPGTPAPEPPKPERAEATQPSPSAPEPARLERPAAPPPPTPPSPAEVQAALAPPVASPPPAAPALAATPPALQAAAPPAPIEIGEPQGFIRGERAQIVIGEGDAQVRLTISALGRRIEISAVAATEATTRALLAERDHLQNELRDRGLDLGDFSARQDRREDHRQEQEPRAAPDPQTSTPNGASTEATPRRPAGQVIA